MKYQRMQFRSYVQADEEIRMLTDEIHGHHPAHAHDDFIEIAYIDSGRGVHIVGEEEARIEAGDLFLFNPHIVHAFTADPDSCLKVCNCIFLPPALDHSFKDCKDFVDVAYHYLFYSLSSSDDPKDYIRLTGVADEEIRQVLYEMQREYDRREGGYVQVLKANLMRLLIFIFRLYKKDDRQRQNPAVYKQLVVQEAAAYIKNHFAEDVSCEMLAERAYLSVNYFRKIFKEITGMTMIRMLQNIRVHVACDLLESTRAPVEEIAAQVGYGDVKFFYKVFKDFQDMTPGAYRKKYAATPRETVRKG